MNFYALLVALILITAFFMNGNQKNCKNYVIVASILLFAIYGLRDTYHIGVDSTTSYIGKFYRLAAMSWAEAIENAGGVNVGFNLMCCQDLF